MIMKVIINAMHDDPMHTLYKSDQMWIQRCQCGVFHVHIGGTSLRFDQAAFEELISGLGQAMSRAAFWRFTRGDLQVRGNA